MFDGVHLGHRAVIDAAVKAARASGGISAVLTFWPHPSALFRPENPTRLIQDGPTKAKVLLSVGVDTVITQPFTPELAVVGAEDFLLWLRQRLPQLVGVYVGENFRFGRGRRGDVALMSTTAKMIGISVFSASRVSFEGEPISSTRIRGLLESGEIFSANRLLGYPYFCEGNVVAGKRLGRTIGFPTINVGWAPALRPRFGVYAVLVHGSKSPVPLPAVANFGLRPTVEESTEPLLEAHLLVTCPFGEGDHVKIEWIRFIRPELKFATLDALRVQIEKDRSAVIADFSLH